MAILDRNALAGLKRTELQALCRERNIKGLNAKKDVLIEILLEFDQNSVNPSTQTALNIRSAASEESSVPGLSSPTESILPPCACESTTRSLQTQLSEMQELVRVLVNRIEVLEKAAPQKGDSNSNTPAQQQPLISTQIQSPVQHPNTLTRTEAFFGQSAKRRRLEEDDAPAITHDGSAAIGPCAVPLPQSPVGQVDQEAMILDDPTPNTFLKLVPDCDEISIEQSVQDAISDAGNELDKSISQPANVASNIPFANIFATSPTKTQKVAKTAALAPVSNATPLLKRSLLGKSNAIVKLQDSAAQQSTPTSSWRSWMSY